MKKEFIAIGILGLFILGYVLDYVAGPISIVIKSPLEFLDPTVLSRFPFTTVSIGIKTLALFSAIILIFSFAKKKFLLKSVLILFVAALFELYSIQQLATGMMIIPIQWTLTLSSTGLLLLIPAVIYFLIGIIHLLINKTLKSDSVSEDET